MVLVMQRTSFRLSGKAVCELSHMLDSQWKEFQGLEKQTRAGIDLKVDLFYLFIYWRICIYNNDNTLNTKSEELMLLYGVTQEAGRKTDQLLNSKSSV